MSRMGDLAATDVYNAFDVPLDQGTNVPGAILNAGNWFLRQAAKPEAEAQQDVRNVMGALAAPVMVPGQMMKPNPYPPGSEEAAFYDASKLQAATQWGPEMALNMVGGGTPFAEAGAIGTSGGKGIRAYHSSPHDFDKFDLAKIGTGEGAQAYGHGLYFAESPAVSGRGGQYWKQFANRGSSGENTATEYLARANFDREKAAQTLRDLLANPPEYTSGYNKMTQERMRTEALKLLEGKEHIGPRTYEVNIGADPAHMLDWDTKIGQQPKAIQDYFRKQIEQFGPEASMEAQYKIARSRAKGGGVELSAGMNEAGIPGIKYLDQGSRNVTPTIERMHRELAGYRERGNKSAVAALEQQIADAQKAQLSSNYVVFDPNIIRIDKKYVIPGAAAGMGALAAQDTYRE